MVVNVDIIEVAFKYCTFSRSATGPIKAPTAIRDDEIAHILAIKLIRRMSIIVNAISYQRQIYSAPSRSLQHFDVGQ